MKHFALRFFAGCIAIAAGIYFRDFWRSDFGPPTFIFLVCLGVTLVMSWRGKGKSWSPLPGLVFGMATAITLTITYFVNLYAGVATLIVLLALGRKTGFLGWWVAKQ